MKKLTLFLVALFALSALCQKRKIEPSLLFEYYCTETNNGGVLDFCCRQPYDRISFLKQNDEYVAKVSISLELKDSVTNEIIRSGEMRTITVNAFDETLNRNNAMQSLLELQLKHKTYLATITLTDLQNNKDIASQKIRVNFNNLKPEFFLIKETNDKFYLVNERKTIPFTSSNYSLLVHSAAVSPQSEMKISCISQTDTLQFSSTSIAGDDFSFKQDSMGIVLQPNKKEGNYFLFKNISQSLPEGRYVVKSNDTEVAAFEVRWWDKPFSLQNPVSALKALSIIESKTVVDSLKDNFGKNWYSILFSYWQKHDPTPSTKFNELLSEFYQRADYVLRHYSNFSNIDGLSTDRGKVFVKLGAPTKIDQRAAENGKMLEIWFYKELNKTFLFKDVTGNGNFILVKE